MPIYRITPAKGELVTTKVANVHPGLGNAVFVNATATAIKEYQDNPRLIIKEYKDPVPPNFKVINL